MKKTLKNYLVVSQFVMAVLMLMVAIYLTCNLPKSRNTEISLIQSMESAVKTADSCNNAVQGTLELTQDSLETLHETVEKGQKIINTTGPLAKKVPFLKDFYTWAENILEQTTKVTASLPDIVDEIQANMQNNLQTLRAIHAQLVETRPISNGIIIGMILFYCLGIVFISNGIVFAMCLRNNNSGELK